MFCCSRMKTSCAKDETIRRVADFIGVPMDEQLLAITEEHTSPEFMLRHEHLFETNSCAIAANVGIAQRLCQGTQRSGR